VTLRRGLALLPEGASVERARLLSLEAKIRMLHGRYREGSVAARAAIQAAHAARDPTAEAMALNALGVCEALGGESEVGVAALRQAVEIARASERPFEFADAYTNLADVLLIQGQHDEALAVAREGRGHEGQSRHAIEWLDGMIAEIAYHAGDWELARRSLPTGRPAPVGTLPANLAMRRAELALGKGDHEEARRELAIAAPIIERSDESQFHGAYGAALAELERRAGDLDAARAAVDAGLDRIEFCSDDLLRMAQVAAAGVAVEADAAQRARDLGDMAALVAAQERAQALIERVEAASAEGRPGEAGLLVGARADLERAQGLARPGSYADAAEAWEALRRPYPAATMRWREAEAHLAKGDRDAGCRAIEQALAAARGIGADWLAAELEGLAARARLSVGGPGEDEAPPAAAPAEDEPFGLTPRERQVLALVAQGATNREIGAELYMAEKTASVHVSRILAKLDVRSRTEAAAVAHRHGLEGAAPAAS
jgi:DNA-binding NarL/FixJ family response regulator